MRLLIVPIVLVSFVASAGAAAAQSVAKGQKPPATQQPKPGAAKPTAPSVPQPPPPPLDYVIGPDDQLAVVFWAEPRMSSDPVVVRPDGKISLPLLNDMQAAGLTPGQLREQIIKEAARFLEDTTVTVIVRQINSRRVYVTGQVARPGPYALTTGMNVVQLLAVAGGLTPYAKEQNISIMRTEGGKLVTLRFNYKDIRMGRNLKQNIELRPGDTVIVP